MGWENYLNKLEGNRKRLINPIGPARKDGLAGNYDQIISNKLTTDRGAWFKSFPNKKRENAKNIRLA